MSKKKSSTTRLLIMQAAEKLFTENGYDGTSMDMLCVNTGFSKATLYNYFPSKGELFVEVMESVFSESADASFGKLAKDLANPEAAFRQFGEQMITMLYSPPAMAVRRVMIAESSRNGVGKRCYEKGPRLGQESMTNIMQQLMSKGVLREADPGVAAMHFRALCDAEFFDIFQFGLDSKITKKHIREAVARAVQAFLFAYGNKDSEQTINEFNELNENTLS